MKKMIFWGGTGQAKVLRECMKDSGYELAVVIDNDEKKPSPFPDIPIYYKKQGLKQWLKKEGTPSTIGFLIAIGGHHGKSRIELQTYLESLGMIPLTAIHPTAFIAHTAMIGTGSQILAGTCICVDVKMGKGCIINTSASIDHECILGNGVHVCPGAHLAGCVQLDDYVMIGTGAAVLPRIKIGEGAIIGAGAVVVKDIAPYSVAVGNPARIIKIVQ